MNKLEFISKKRHKVKWVFVLTTLFWLADAGLALAQQWLSNRQYTEGMGVKLGSSLVFHPGLGVEGGYDTNVYYSEDNTVGAARLRIAPYFDFATLPPQRMTEESSEGQKPSVEFRLGLAGVYEDWFGKDQSLNDRRDFGVMANLLFVLFPYGKWRLKIDDSFSRTITPPNETAPFNYTRDYNEAGLGVKFVPGDALNVGLQYQYILNFYEEEFLRDAGNYQMHKVQLNALWKFLPKTAVTFDGEFYPFLRKSDHLNGTNIYVSDLSYELNLWLGIVGLFTSRFGAALRTGYAGGFYSGGDELDTWLLQAELRFFTTPTSVLRAGFIRDRRPSYFTNYYLRNEGYLTYEQLIKGRILVSGKVLGAYHQYAAMYEGTANNLQESDLMTPNPRMDWYISTLLFAEYRIRDYIAINLTLQFDADITDAEVSAPAYGQIPEQYYKFSGFLGVTRTMKKPSRRFYPFQCFLLLVFVGCSTDAKRTVRAPETIQQDTTLGPGDIFDVRVYNEEGLSNTYQIAPDGTIDYPLIERITVAGLNPQEIASLIARKLVEGKFLKNPQVSVLVKEYKSKKIHVLGQVKNPGTFPFQENMNVVQAITLAGGFTPIANENKTTITRKIEGKEVIIRAPVGKISKGEAPNISLQAGDILYVPERVF